MRISDWSSDVCSSDLKERGRQRAYIVEGEDGRYHLPEIEPFAQNPHQQRDLEPDEEADGEDDRVKRYPEMVDHREQQEERGRRASADQRDEQLDPDEQPQGVAPHIARAPAADAHGEEIAADEDRKSTRLTSSHECASRIPS